MHEWANRMEVILKKSDYPEDTIQYRPETKDGEFAIYSKSDPRWNRRYFIPEGLPIRENLGAVMMGVIIEIRNTIKEEPPDDLLTSYSTTAGGW